MLSSSAAERKRRTGKQQRHPKEKKNLCAYIVLTEKYLLFIFSFFKGNTKEKDIQLLGSYVSRSTKLVVPLIIGIWKSQMDLGKSPWHRRTTCVIPAKNPTV